MCVYVQDGHFYFGLARSNARNNNQELTRKVVLYVILVLRGIVLGFDASNVDNHPSDGRGYSLRPVKRPTAASYKVRIATPWAFGGTAVVAAFFIRESLVWPIDRDHVEKTEESLQRLCTGGGGGESLVDLDGTALAHEEDDC
ncbi:hypothetical protein CDEST_04468 [Colletotrichum destructivum]|uniref:Uncharacterized protein n=1 Tax=Colletotrichum destructivum TaxID=34406 RepID=A0AAX4I873_9PEZI|nr:hypothetical protein CDEST_04468 [Colletotrichum destructivum]